MRATTWWWAISGLNPRARCSRLLTGVACFVGGGEMHT